MELEENIERPVRSRFTSKNIPTIIKITESIKMYS